MTDEQAREVIAAARQYAEAMNAALQRRYERPGSDAERDVHERAQRIADARRRLDDALSAVPATG
jgi:hypothetical protein